ncbi:MAG: cation:proton antiporter [Alphaproteobacteria bacterium]|nr:cation:proton antiporter [Alphaproteobacteria bacterium]
MHELAPIAITLTFTTIIGIVMVSMRQPAMLGYMLCGVLLGPSGFGLIEDRDSVNFLAELGVILLLYFIGMELSLSVFRNIWRLALITAGAQIILSIVAVFGFAQFVTFDPLSAVVLGLCLAFSSTAVAMKMLENYNLIHKHSGRVAMGVLVAQDLAVAPALIAINIMGTNAEISALEIIRYSLGMLALVGTCIYFVQRPKINLPFHRIWLIDADLAPLGSIMLCLTAAAIASALGMSAGFGAFFIGLIVANSRQRHNVHDSARPLQSLLMMVFFLAVGLLIDLTFLQENWVTVLTFWLLVLVFKTLLNIALLRIQGTSMQCSIIASLSLSQLGEFSFMLTAVAFSVGLLDDYLRQMVISVTAVSLMTSPLYFDAIRRLDHRAAQRTNSTQVLRLIYFREFRWLRWIRGAIVTPAKRFISRRSSDSAPEDQ